MVSIPFKTFFELAKWVYIHEAKEECKIPLKKTSFSRIATLTGIRRSEVERIGKTTSPNELDDVLDISRHNRAARAHVISTVMGLSTQTT